MPVRSCYAYDLFSIYRYFRAKFDGDDEEMCLYALQSGMLGEAHRLFVEKIAPRAVLNGKLNANKQ